MGGERLDWTSREEDFLKRNSRFKTISELISDLKLVHNFDVTEVNLRNKLSSLGLQFKSLRGIGFITQEEFLFMLDLNKKGVVFSDSSEHLKCFHEKYDKTYISNTYYKVGCILRNYPGKDNEEYYQIYKKGDIKDLMNKNPETKSYKHWSDDEKLDLVLGLKDKGAKYYADKYGKSITYIYHLSSKFKREIESGVKVESDTPEIEDTLEDPPIFDEIKSLSKDCIVTEINFDRMVGNLCIFGATIQTVERIAKEFCIKSLLDPDYHNFIGVLESMKIGVTNSPDGIKRVVEYIDDKDNSHRIAVSIRDI
jgi:hypothetical protein